MQPMCVNYVAGAWSMCTHHQAFAHDQVLLADGGRGEKTSYGPAIDIWSLGCIFAEFVLNTPLLAGQGEIDQVKRIFEMIGPSSHIAEM